MIITHIALVKLILSAYLNHSFLLEPGRSVVRPTPDLGVEMIATPGRADEGEDVSVVGVLSYGDDRSGIWSSRAELEVARRSPSRAADIARHCLYVEAGRVPIRRLRRYDGSFVRITGRVIFIAPDSLDALWACNSIGIQVITMERR